MAKSKGLNATLTTQGLGTYRVRCVAIGFGANVISSQSTSRRRKAFYPMVTTTSGFGLTAVFVSWEDREKFNNWLRTYMEKTVDSRGFKAVMRVDVPSRGWSKEAIAEGPVIYGEGLKDMAYYTNISFTGATDALRIGADTRTDRSYFELPDRNAGNSSHFYPGGVQLSGAADLDGSLFDYPDDTRQPIQTFSDAPTEPLDGPGF